jgi:SAM-dependent methyltransferase
MAARFDPAAYNAWYDSRRGAWIGNTEFALLMKTLRPSPGATLLDVGCGTGYFSRRFSDAGLRITGVDPDEAMLSYAASRNSDITYLQASALRLPFRDQSFDYVSAITSLCFIEPPAQAVAELWRVSRRAVILGLLNRHSLLYHTKHNQGGYKGARWDSVNNVHRWLELLTPDFETEICSAIFSPSGNLFARMLEKLLPNRLSAGGFLAVRILRR